MSNSNDTQGPSQAKKFDQHPDFEELLKAEQSRTGATKKEVNQEGQPEGLDLDDEFEHFEDYEEDFDEEESVDHDNPIKDKSPNSPSLKNGDKKNEDFGDFSEIASASNESEDQEAGHILDDSMEFNFEDTPSSLNESSADKKPSVNIKKAPVKKSGGMFFYIIIGVIVVVGGGVLYALTHKSAHTAAQVSSIARGTTGFKPVLPEVHQLPQTLPPAVPQSAAPVTTSMMSNGSDEEILPDTVQNGAAGAPGITMMQINRQQLLGLLANFQKTVTESGKSVTDQVSTLKNSLAVMTSSDVAMSQEVNTKLEQMKIEMNQANQKLDAYNQSISGVQSALEKTQQQLKLILAERAEDIDHYTLRAIVPGRLWLVDGQGRTVTLTLGEDLKNYGTVEEINDKMGFVTMSSGYVFK